MIVDYAVYDAGARRHGGLALEDVYEACRIEGSFAWVGLHEPTAEELDQTVHPELIAPVRLNRQPVDERALRGVVVFVLL
ncbi:MAG: hypothetical protein H0T39_05975, partial [Actinobacteria bacterium]|nr:hypothetical protein [Actinomycetota bacterium]